MFSVELGEASRFVAVKSKPFLCIVKIVKCEQWNMESRWNMLAFDGKLSF